MSKMVRWVAAIAMWVSGAAGASTVLSYPDFNSTAGLQLNGVAASVGGVLRLTPANYGQAGSVFSTSPVSLASGSSFSTYFQFQLSAPGGSCDGFGCGADGIVFVVQTLANNVGGGGGGIGYLGVGHSIGIEFDTWYNSGNGDLDSNHVGIDVNGSVSSLTQRFVSEADMNNGAIWNAWIDYDSATTALEVRLSQSASRPGAAFLSIQRDISLDLGSTNAFVGFTSGTGAAFANHDILNWQLNDNYSPIDLGNAVPEPGSLALAGAALALLVIARRPRAAGRAGAR
jgi:hypothetical protein